MHVESQDIPEGRPSAGGGRLRSTGGRALALVGTAISARAAGGLARVVVEQRFRNVHREPLEVTFSLPLPHEAAVAGFSFRVGAERIEGRVERRADARATYERALADGRGAALLDEERSTLFTQRVGNVPPGEELVAEVVVDHRLLWLVEGAWEWRFPTVVSPRYLGAPGRVADADAIHQDVAAEAMPARVDLALQIVGELAGDRRPESPSHRLRVETRRGCCDVTLTEGLVAADRDLVVRWPVALPAARVAVEAGRVSAGAVGYGIVTIVPPRLASASVARDVVVLLDTSGSMAGAPLNQAVRVISALVDTLSANDRLEMIQFASEPRRWLPHPVAAGALERERALAWLGALRAGGGTEMRAGILAALEGTWPGAQRQILVATDGQVGFEAEIVASIARRLPRSSRVHTLGVGSAVNRSLTAQAARAGGGVEIITGLDEDAERGAARLLACTSAPLLVDLELGGSALVEHAPARLPDVFAGSPAITAVALRPEGGSLLVRARTPDGIWEQRLDVPALAEGEPGPPRALFGRERVADLERDRAASPESRGVIDIAIERTGLEFAIATRRTSWVATSRDRLVDPRSSRLHDVVPQELPYGVSAEALGLRAPMRAMLCRLPDIDVGYRGGGGARAPVGRKTGIDVWSGREGVPMPSPAGPARRATVDPRDPPGAAYMRPGSRPARTGAGGAFRARPASQAESNQPRPKKPKKPNVDRHAPPDRLRGAVLQWSARSGRIEITAGDAGLTWEPQGAVLLELPGGRVERASIDRAASSPWATVAAGAIVHLALVLSGDAHEPPLRVTLTIRGKRVMIDC